MVEEPSATSGVRIDRSELALTAILQAVRLHNQKMMAHYGERPGLIQFSKHLKRYLADVLKAQAVFSEMLRAETVAAFTELLDGLETVVTQPWD